MPPLRLVRCRRKVRLNDDVERVRPADELERRRVDAELLVGGQIA